MASCCGVLLDDVVVRFGSSLSLIATMAKIIAAAMPPIQNKPFPPDDLFVEGVGEDFGAWPHGPAASDADDCSFFFV